MSSRGDWSDLARDLDWTFSYVSEKDVYPEEAAGAPHLPAEAWRSWDEPYKTTFAEYVRVQSDKDAAVYAVRDALGRLEDFAKLDPVWKNALKLHAATLPLAEFAAIVGNLRGARFGRTSAWRTAATFGALDELRHAQIPMLLMHPLVRVDPQFDWVHKLYHSNDWVAIAARHIVDELLLGSNAIEFAIATHFVFETGFTNLQFIGLSSVAHDIGDRMFEKMVTSIQSDEARHAQIGRPVLETVAKHDRAYAQHLVDKWFWRSWLLFAVVTGIAMDYLTPLSERRRSFKEFVEEWVLDQFMRTLDDLGLDKPWYWSIFLEALENYHHMVYASAYTYRASVWFDMVVPSPRERAWLRTKYPRSWPAYEPVWERIASRWREADVNNDFAVHGSAIVTFCELCQLVLSGGTPAKNSAVVATIGGQKRIFCSEPCKRIYEREPERYADHKDVVKRVLAGEAPANLIALVQRYFGLDPATWGRDVFGGAYAWIDRTERGARR
jgi:toluene monooxygenase system protein A